MTENEAIYFTKMLDELRVVKEKYKLPKGILFVPDRLEIAIKRNSYDNLHLSYKEYFDYLPDTVLDIVLPMTINMLVQSGIPKQQIKRISKNGASMELNGSAEMITGMVLSELLIQKNFNEDEIEKLVIIIKRTIKGFTDSSNLKFEYNDELGKEFFNILAELLAVTQNNPSMALEVQEIVNKYSQTIEKVRTLIEEKNQSKESTETKT